MLGYTLKINHGWENKKTFLEHVMFMSGCSFFRLHDLRYFGVCIWIACFSSVGLAGSPASWRGQSITEFTSSENENFAWKIVNDGVMGGLSKGNVEHTSDNIMHFWGTLSLDNNGGFSTVRSRGVDFDLSNDLGLLLLVRGDGRTYEARLDSTATFRGNPISFLGKFKTTPDRWMQVKIPFASFTGSWRGRQFPKETLDTSAIKRVSVLLADKTPGPFDLRVQWIRTYGKGQGEKQSLTKKTILSERRGLIDTAVADGRFIILKKLLDAANLTVFFQWDNPLTIFAPTDEAFSKLPDGLLDALLEPESHEKLVTLLSYHVATGSLREKNAVEKKSIKMIQGGKVTVTSHAEKTYINDAIILDADIQCADGIIHAIDAVLIPETEE